MMLTKQKLQGAIAHLRSSYLATHAKFKPGDYVKFGEGLAQFGIVLRATLEIECNCLGDEPSISPILYRVQRVTRSGSPVPLIRTMHEDALEATTPYEMSCIVVPKGSVYGWLKLYNDGCSDVLAICSSPDSIPCEDDILANHLARGIGKHGSVVSVRWQTSDRVNSLIDGRQPYHHLDGLFAAEYEKGLLAGVGYEVIAVESDDCFVNLRDRLAESVGGYLLMEVHFG